MRFPREAEIQPGGIDGKEDPFGRGCDEVAKRPPRPPDLGEMAEDFGEAHHRDRLHRSDDVKPGRSEGRSAEPGRLEGGASRTERVQERRPQPVSGRISGRQDERRKPQTATPATGL